MADIMYLSADCGNSLLKFSLLDKKSIIKKFNAIEYIKAEETLKDIINQYNISALLISSVNINESEILRKTAEKFALKKYEIGKDIQVIPFEYETPETLGIDRLLSAAGASRISEEKNIIVADAGTALTIDIVHEGIFKGGIIFPGIQTAANSLHQKTSLLPKIEIQRTKRLTGNSTASCINAGFYNSYRYILEGFARDIEKKYNSPFKKIITGGWGDLVELYDWVYNRDLISEGFIEAVCILENSFKK